MTSEEVRRRFLSFFEKRGHSVISSASLVPENDPTVLFNTAGMQPLVPYLMGAKHPKGNKLVDVQKCVRTTDIDEIGDNTHATFFEMLGNWSLGSYFKEDAIKWSYEFLTAKEEGLALDPKRLYVTVFAGDENAERDTESAKIWQKLGVPENRIYFKDSASNWWPAVKGNDTWTGPTGPCSEMFYDITPEGLGDLTQEQYEKADEEQKIVEIWNDVFMEYEKVEGKIVGKLKQKNVDTGAGLERLLMVIQKTNNIFDTDLFVGLMEETKRIASTLKSQRVIADHVRTAVFMIADGVLPSNTDRGYILRRIMRRAFFHSDKKSFDKETVDGMVNALALKYKSAYPELRDKTTAIKEVILEENKKFSLALERGLKEFSRISKDRNEISGSDAFDLFSSHGLPIDIITEIAKEDGKSVDKINFEERFKAHQQLSRSGSEKKFKGGLADTGEMSVKYHTATHMLNAALKKVLGENISQKGSNITSERLRFDFTHNEKMTDEQKKQVEEIINKKIAEALPVSFQEMPLEKAREIGAIGVFGDKYSDKVNVYTIGDAKTGIFSQEICGGPHVENTSVLGHFKISKEEAVSAGVRRIKAVLE
jgi:alanyl-tRNA synthetase